jgi:hypothetical protein
MAVFKRTTTHATFPREWTVSQQKQLRLRGLILSVTLTGRRHVCDTLSLRRPDDVKR